MQFPGPNVKPETKVIYRGGNPECTIRKLVQRVDLSGISEMLVRLSDVLICTEMFLFVNMVFD